MNSPTSRCTPFEIQHRRVRRVSAPIALAAVLMTSACMSTSKQTEFMRSRAGVEVQAGTAEMRLRTVGYARRAAGLIEEAADEIGDRAEDPQIRKAALRW
jgi:hypothetical protein